MVGSECRTRAISPLESGAPLETSLTGQIEVRLHKGRRLKWPRAETPTHYIAMGLHEDLDEANRRQHTPKVAFVAKSADYVASSGRRVAAADIDLLVRALSMGKLHHAMMGTAAVAIGTAAAIPGTLVNLAAGGGERTAVRFGHPSGTLRVGAEAKRVGDEWTVTRASMSRSARVLMEGRVRVTAT